MCLYLYSTLEFGTYRKFAKASFKTRLASFPMGLHILNLVKVFIYNPTLAMRAAKVVASLCIDAGSPVRSLLYNALSLR